MKPLKEIGIRYQPSPKSLTQYEPFTQYTDEERRELVRRVWEKASDEDEFEKVSFEEFLKIEGL